MSVVKYDVERTVRGLTASVKGASTNSLVRVVLKLYRGERSVFSELIGLSDDMLIQKIVDLSASKGVILKITKQ